MGVSSLGVLSLELVNIFSAFYIMILKKREFANLVIIYAQRSISDNKSKPNKKK
jgi:hypothetical protein